MEDRVDPYSLDPADVREPPVTWREQWPYLGPGFILSASIVGSGELIATTAMGAEVGFVGLWIILLSCVIKVAIQLQFGRRAILTGETAIESLDRLRGPRMGRVNWAIWFWLAIQPLKILQVGGIVGGVAILTAMVIPAISVTWWCWIAVVVVASLVAFNRYQMIERAALALLFAFTALTLASVIALQWTEFAISSGSILSGLQGELPAGALLVIFAAFGLTGVGGDEILQYTYWLLEKGYAAYCGEPAPGNPDWQRRARGWIRVMYLDALLSMVAYTIVTVAFYLLGAAVLNAQGLTPEGHNTITTLANMYTNSLGPWANAMFLAGAFAVLFSTLFSALASWTRIFADAFSKLGWCDFREPTSRKRMIRFLAWAFPISWAVVYQVYEAPVAMVVLGGVATSALLLLVVYAALVFWAEDQHSDLKPGLRYNAAVWISGVSIAAFALYGLVRVIGLA